MGFRLYHFFKPINQSILRAFSSKSHSVPKVQFMHVIQEKNSGKGRLHMAIPDIVSKLPSLEMDVIKHSKIQKEFMIEQARDVCKGMQDILLVAQGQRGSYEVSINEKAPNGNTVVHVSTPEFFFYPAGSVFSQEIFQHHIETPLRQALRKFPSWLKFHFGTLPIQLSTGEFNGQVVNPRSFINAALYGSCGSDAIVRFYSKKNHCLPSPYAPGGKDTIHLPSHPGDPYVTQLNPIALDYPTVFISQTEVGNRIIITMEICLDHDNRRGIKEFHGYMEKCKQLGEVSSLHGFHAVSSNSITLNRDNSAFPIVSHADHNMSNVVVFEAQNTQQVSSTMEKVWRYIFDQELEKIDFIKLNAPNTWVDAKLKVYKTLSMTTAVEYAYESRDHDLVPGSKR